MYPGTTYLAQNISITAEISIVRTALMDIFY